MVAERGEYAQRGFYLPENGKVVLHFVGGVVYQVAGKKHHVGLLAQQHFHAARHGAFVEETARMDVRQLRNPHSVERFGQVLEPQRHAADAVVVRPDQNAVARTNQRHGSGQDRRLDQKLRTRNYKPPPNLPRKGRSFVSPSFGGGRGEAHPLAQANNIIEQHKNPGKELDQQVGKHNGNQEVAGGGSLETRNQEKQ